MVKIGQSDATVDPQFNQLEAQFKEQYHKVKKFGRFVEKYQAAVKDLGNAQKGIASMVLDQYDSSDGMHQVATHYNESITGQIEAQRIQMEQHYNEMFHLPLNQYLGQYKIMEERINERNTRLVDMDRYNADLKMLMSKPDTDPTRLQIAKEKAEYKSREYNDLNEELVRDIPALLRDRSRFFDGLFANLVRGKAQYFAEAAKTMGLMSPHLAQVNRSGASTRPFVITEPSRSSHAGSVSLPAGSAPSPHSSQAPAPAPGPSFSQTQMQSQVPPRAMPQAQQAAAPAPGTRQAKALFPFSGQDNTEISFQPGQTVTVISQSGDWWVGEVNGARGYFPSNYVQLM
eukprot:CAMPEP_0206190296 /NCGR_PEP_ID=MMETSP0166-20121206/4669_1 /ASSEMBLY_ACC=CAM_ASM_000260 /TAXON_ID=95228 /ORGANISM="Vannella robusta, Strain DIVA3 518/3/11/1/6" /LENGTH=343 /DNA_ID=CAMNT_0053606355 /DNA_START=599 /DNA_END=1630 /DNA_ORIENTATION=-